MIIDVWRLAFDNGHASCFGVEVLEANSRQWTGRYRFWTLWHRESSDGNVGAKYHFLGALYAWSGLWCLTSAMV